MPVSVPTGGVGLKLSIIDNFSNNLRKYDSMMKRSRAASQAFTSGLKTSAMRLGIATVAAAGLGYALHKALQPGLAFEKQMREVSAVTGATAEEFKAMTNVAKKLGIETVFSAKAAAGAMYMLGSRGVKTAKQFEILLVPAMDLAAALKFDLVPATELMMATLKMFDMEMTDATQVADLLTNAYRNSAANAEKLAISMNYAGFAFSSVGYTLRETLVPLEALYDLGLEASIAGTSLRKSISSLIKPTTEAKKTLIELGLSVADVNPQFHSFIDIIETLEKSLISPKQALTLFGERAGPAMSKLISMGADALREYDAGLGAVGSASETAKEQLKGFQGALVLIKSSLEMVFIAFEELLAPALEETTRWVTEQINAFLKWIMTSNKMVKGIQDFMKAYGSMIRDLLKPSLRILKDLVTGVITLIGTWSKMSAVQKEFVMKGIKVGTLLATLGIAVGILGPAVLGLAKAFSILGISAHLFNLKFMLILGAFALGVAAVYLLQAAWKKNWGKISKFISDESEKINEDIRNILFWLGEIKDWIIIKFKWTMEKVGPIWDAVAQFFLDAKDWLTKKFSWTLEKAGKTWDWFTNTFIPMLWSWSETTFYWTLNLAGIAWDKFNEIVQWLKLNAIKAFHWSLIKMGETWDWLTNELWPWLKKWGVNILEWTLKLPGEVWGWLKDTLIPWLVGAKEKTFSWFLNLGPTFQKFLDLINILKDWVTKTFNWTINIGFPGKALEKIEELKEWLVDIPNKLKALSGAFTFPISALGEFTKNLDLSGRKAIASINEISDTVGQAMGVEIPNHLKVMTLALIATESSFDQNAKAVSALGNEYRGWGQLGEAMIKDLERLGITIEDVNDPTENLTGTMGAFLVMLKRSGGDVKKAILLYKGWGKELDKAGGSIEKLPKEAKKQLAKFLKLFEVYMKKTGQTVDKGMDYVIYGKSPGGLVGSFQDAMPQLNKVFKSMLSILGDFMGKIYGYLKTVPGLGKFIQQFEDLIGLWKRTERESVELIDQLSKLDDALEKVADTAVESASRWVAELEFSTNIAQEIQNRYRQQELWYWGTFYNNVLGIHVETFEDMEEILKELPEDVRATLGESLGLWKDYFNVLTEENMEYYRKVTGYMGDFGEMTETELENIKKLWEDNVGKYKSIWDSFIASIKSAWHSFIVTILSGTEDANRALNDLRDNQAREEETYRGKLISALDDYHDYRKLREMNTAELEKLLDDEVTRLKEINLKDLTEDQVRAHDDELTRLENLKTDHEDAVDDMKDKEEELIEKTDSVGQAFKALGKTIKDSFIDAFAKVLVEKAGFDKIFEGNILNLGNLFKGLGNLVVGVFKGIGNIIGGIFGGIGGAVGGALGGTTVVAGQLAQTGVAAEATAAKMGIMTKIGLGLQSVVTGIGGALKYFATMGSGATTVLGALSSGLVGVAGFVGTAIASWTAFSYLAENVIGPAFHGIKKFISELLGIDTRPWFEEIAESAERTGKYLAETSEKLASDLLSPQMLASFSGRLVRFAEVVASGLVTIGEMTHEESVKWLTEAIQTNEHLTEEYKNTLLGILEASKDGAQAVAEAAKEAMAGYHNEILLLDHQNRDLIERGSKASADMIAKQVVATEEAIKKTTGAVKKSFEEQLSSLKRLTDYGTEAYWHFYREAKRSFEETADSMEDATEDMEKSWDDLTKETETAAKKTWGIDGTVPVALNEAINAMIDKIGTLPTRVDFDVVGNLYMPRIPSIATRYFNIIGRVQTPSYQRGLPYVPQVMPVIVHKKEAILTAPQAEKWRKGEGGGIHIGSINLQLPNIRNSEDLENMSVIRWKRVFDKGLLPAMKMSAREGRISRESVMME